jgi:predicted RNA-binding protein YlqC (UPF0109 family)
MMKILDSEELVVVEKIDKLMVDKVGEFLSFMVKQLVDHSDNVQVDVIPATYKVMVELHTNPEDVGQVVGRKGVVIGSIRNLMYAFAGKHGMQIDLQYITEQQNNDQARNSPEERLSFQVRDVR